MSEWIKVEHHIHEKIEVAAIAEHTGLDPDTVVGKLCRVWAWASRNCHADGVTGVTALRVIREITGTEKFDEAMANCGWIRIKGDKIEFANFDRHNSQTAKERALATQRKWRQRSREFVTKMSRTQRDKIVTREDNIIGGGKATPPKRCL
jgi:DNA replication protein DnaT